jgi:hypothetical protein
MRRTWWLILTCVACGANPAPESPIKDKGPAGAPDFLYTGDQVEFRLAHETQIATAALNASKAEAWKALIIVYQDLGFAVGFADPNAGRIGHPALIFNRTIAGQPSSMYLDCGYGVGGPRTSTHRLRMSISNVLESVNATRTLLHTQILVTAQSNEGSSSDEQPCTTTGALEQRIAVLVAARLQPGVPGLKSSK